MWFAFKRVRKIAASHQVCWWQWRLLAEFIGGILNADPKCWRVSCIGFVCVAKSIGVGHITHLHPIATHVIVMEDCLSQDDDPVPYLPPSLSRSRPPFSFFLWPADYYLTFSAPSRLQREGCTVLDSSEE